jgi:hypothetical protein
VHTLALRGQLDVEAFEGIGKRHPFAYMSYDSTLQVESGHTLNASRKFLDYSLNGDGIQIPMMVDRTLP